MQNTVTSADADWSGMSEDETMTNCNALKPERSMTFLEIVVRYPGFCTYPEHEGKPYYAIKYEENGETIVGFGTYKPEILSKDLREYFISSAEPERKWIPVTEALPKVRTDVLLAFEKNMAVGFYSHDCWNVNTGNGFYTGVFTDEDKPIAWMPLPEPWRGE